MAQQGKYEEAMRRCKIALQIREEAFKEKEASELPIGYSSATLGIIYLNAGNLRTAFRDGILRISLKLDEYNIRRAVWVVFLHFYR